MNKKIKNDLQWLEFPLLSSFKEVQHACLQKQGGFSPYPFDSLSFSTSSGDSLPNVHKNRDKVKETFEIKRVLFLNLEHKDNILIINTEEDLRDFFVNKPLADAAITPMRDLALVATHADCQVVLLYDPVQKVIGAIHAGWRGNVQNILAKTIKAMYIHYQCEPFNVYACISPSLGPKASQFIHAKEEFPKDFFAFEWKKDYFNLWEISRFQLLQAGLVPEHIEIANICTYENKNYFSYRREKITGRNASFINLVNN